MNVKGQSTYAKLNDNQWLYKRYVAEDKTMEDIAEEIGYSNREFWEEYFETSLMFLTDGECFL